MYPGLKQPRVRGEEYEALIAEFITAAKEVYGRHVLLQFEDFGNTTAFGLLETHRETTTCFNDDIQGTASVALAGLISSLPLAFCGPAGSEGKRLADHTFLFYGAGEAGVGIADLVAMEISNELGCTVQEARTKIWLMDSKGLIYNERSDREKMAHHKLPYTHPSPAGFSGVDANNSLLVNAIRTIKPTVLVGVSAQPKAFDKAAIDELVISVKEHSEKGGPHAPVIMALSNPTSKCEVSAADAYDWTSGNGIFMSGSPFDAITLPDGRHKVPGQGNNAYIFPGVGLGVLAAKGLTITDNDFIIAAKNLAEMVTEDMRKVGGTYPPLSEIRPVSRKIALAVATEILKSGRSNLGSAAPDHTNTAAIEQLIDSQIYDPWN
jgi:malate dehydrogenase (oxaloacetate-decarboxylating)(NADP+)